MATRGLTPNLTLRGPEGEAEFIWGFRTTRYLVPCVLRLRMRVEILQDGRLADVRGNGLTVDLVLNLPEGSRNRLGRTWASVTWTNWCGSWPVTVRWSDPQFGERTVPRPSPPAIPTCRDSTKPSVLEAQVAG